MTDIATLALKIDSTQAKTAADNLNLLGKASSAAEGSVNSAGREWVRAGSAAAQLRMQSQSAAQGADKLASSARVAGQAASEMARDAQQASVRMNAVTTSAGAQRAGLQQLSYQLGDVATMFAMGARPMQIFASQGSQVIQAVSLMAGGTSRLAAFLGGPWGTAISVAAIALSPFIAKLFETANAADEATAALDRLIKKRRDEAQEQLTLTNAIIATNNLRKQEADLIDTIRKKSGVDYSKQNLTATAPKFSYSEYQELLAVRQKIAAAQGSINAESYASNDAANRKIAERIDLEAKLGGAISKSDKAQAQYNIRIREANERWEKSNKGADAQAARLAAMTAAERDLNAAQQKTHKTGGARIATLAREAEATDTQTTNLLKLADAYLSADANALKLEVTARAMSEGIKKRADIDAYVARQLSLEVAKRAADGAKEVSTLRDQTAVRKDLNDQVQAGLITSEEANRLMQDEAALRPLIAAQAIAEGEAKAKLGKIIAELRDQQKAANDEAKRAQDLAQAAETRNDMKLIAEETRLTGELGKARIAAMKGLRGDALEDELARLDLQREKSLRTAQAEAQAEKERAAGLYDSAKATLESAEAANKLSDQEFVNDQAVRNIERANAGLNDMISLLEDIGGLGGVLGGVLGGLVNGNFSGLGSLGGVANIFLKKGGLADYQKQADVIATRISDVFGVSGQFAKTMGSLLQGAGTGALAANAIFGKQSKTEQLGSSIGGALGQVAGQALGKALGGIFSTVGGPLGAIAGGILGSVVGGLLKSHKYGRVTLSDVTGDFDTGGNKGKFKQAATDAGNSIVDALNQIAKELGGVAGAFGDITVGVRDGKWRVNTTGTSLKTGKGAVNFGEDSAAAISYAIQQAVKQGAISGINQSVLNLLQASGDFETQLSKAAELQNIFSEIAQSADPMGYELEQLAKKFASVNALLAEANATQEEIDSVANYQAQQEAAIRARYAAEAAAKKAARDEKEAELLALQGRASEALAKARAAELAQMDAGLAAIQKQIYAETDAATKRALQIQLLEAQGNAWAATQAQRDEVLRTTVDENKALQTRIFLTQDLYDAYKRESDALQDTATKMRGFSDTLRDFRASIFASDNSTTSYTQALAKLIQTGSLAATGDETALGNLAGVGRDYLDAAKAGAGSLLDYQRAQALVANYTDQAIGFTDSAASQAEQSLALMKEQVGSLISIDDHVVTVAEALERLIALNTPTTASSSSSDSGSNSSESSSSSSAGFNSLKESMEALRRQILSMQRTWTQFSPDGQSMQVVIAP